MFIKITNWQFSQLVMFESSIKVTANTYFQNQIVVTSKWLAFANDIFIASHSYHLNQMFVIKDNFILKWSETVILTWHHSNFDKSLHFRWRCNLRSAKWKTDWSRTLQKRYTHTNHLKAKIYLHLGEHSWRGDWGAEEEVWGFKRFQNFKELKKRQLWPAWWGQG